jgi:hypothetical protein
MSDEQEFLRTGHPTPSGDNAAVYRAMKVSEAQAQWFAEAEEVLALVREWRRMQAYAGHNELQAKLAQIAQAVDRFERTQ